MRNGLGCNGVPPAKLVGACVLAGCVGMGMAFLAAVVTGRTSVSEAAVQLTDRRAHVSVAAPPAVTFDRRRDRLDPPSRKAAKSDFLADVVVPLDPSQRQLKPTRHIQASIIEPVKAVADDTPGRVASIGNIAGDVGTGPVSLIGAVFEATVAEGTERGQSARPERQSRDLGRTAEGAARGVSGVAGRATGALGL